MAFVAGTPILTDSGYKNIEDISGRDKVLVRNFLGDAEFIQPFALKKRQYDGKILQIGAKTWSFSVTPEHMVAYERLSYSPSDNFFHEPAKKISIDKNNRILRQFKYLPAEDYKNETVVIHTEFGKKWSYVQPHDWFVLVGYVLCRGYLDESGPRKKALTIYLDKNKREQEVILLGDILDRIGVEWSLIPSYTDDRWMIRVKSNNTLANRIETRLGSSKRKDMYLPDKMVYNASKTLVEALVSTLKSITRKPDTKSVYKYTTNNEKLLNSLSMMCTLWGYGNAVSVIAKKGVDNGRGALRKDVLQLEFWDVVKSYTPTFINELDYSGKVYEIDLFDGQVYVKEGSQPVWIDPK